MIDIEQRDGIMVVRMNRGRGNTLNAEFLAALVEALDEVQRSPARALVLTGKGKIFCAGVDLQNVVSGGANYLREFLPALSQFLKQLALLPMPVVAAVNGHAIAGGCIGVLACDYRVLAQGRGRLGLTELLVGVPLPTWPLEIARFAIPNRYLQAVLYTGQLFLPDESLQRGLVDEVVPADRLLDRSIEVARAFAEIPTETFRLTKKHLRDPLLERVEQRIDRDDPKLVQIWSDPERLKMVNDFMASKVQHNT